MDAVHIKPSRLCDSSDLPLAISEAKVVAAASAFGSLGLKAAGYQYINIDVSRFEVDERIFDKILGLLVSDQS